MLSVHVFVWVYINARSGRCRGGVENGFSELGMHSGSELGMSPGSEVGMSSGSELGMGSGSGLGMLSGSAEKPGGRRTHVTGQVIPVPPVNPFLQVSLLGAVVVTS